MITMMMGNTKVCEVGTGVYEGVEDNDDDDDDDDDVDGDNDDDEHDNDDDG